ncbi:penicillin-binding protein activator LpoB [Psychromonas sp. MB-3u-54]|uniref:penicillin-binding protein activator LpoB n=1 Tax=Psychromonas sp. MB-3u-54 TaxID=2058319 RepID=UPI000C31E87E|nr:penicillin-binding protein activator LpoB [Psychromonas sp. MB-3u-54]PKH01488.1 penicillin-binding protein activator LpoB [Psychromonas sp. MB-3u-54]
MKIQTNLWFALAVTFMMTGCSTSVERIDAQEQIDLSGAWNDTDSQLVAREMIDDSLSRPWIVRFVSETGKDPVVIIGSVKNLSHEHINTNTFVANMERDLINSGQVQFVASAVARQEIRAERGDQGVNATADTRNAARQEYGADFMMQGQINTIIDIEGKTQVRYYQVNLELISIKDNRKVWVGEKRIKKLVRNSQLRQ